MYQKLRKVYLLSAAKFQRNLSAVRWPFQKKNSWEGIARPLHWQGKGSPRQAIMKAGQTNQQRSQGRNNGETLPIQTGATHQTPHTYKFGCLPIETTGKLKRCRPDCVWLILRTILHLFIQYIVISIQGTLHRSLFLSSPNVIPHTPTHYVQAWWTSSTRKRQTSSRPPPSPRHWVPAAGRWGANQAK